MKVAQDIWEKYGFSGNPFDTTPLTNHTNSLLPIEEAFTGRKTTKEFKILTNFLRNPGGGRAVIEGEVGVGKTSFLNYHRYLWENHSRDKLLSPLDEISISPGWKLRHFLVNVLGMVVAKLLSLNGGEALIENNKTLKEIYGFTNALFHYQSGYNFQLGPLGAGWSNQEDFHLPEIPETQLLHYFKKMVQEICHFGYSGLLLHLDNLDVSQGRSIEMLREFFDDIRDTLQTPRVYSVFVGTPGLFSEVISPLPRVRSIFFSRPIQIGPLSPELLLEAIQKRYSLLSLKGNYVQPVEEEFLLYLYKIYSGNIRFIMDGISNLIQEVDGDNAKTQKTKDSQKILKQIVREKMEHLLTPREQEVLKVALELDRFTNQQISRFTGMASSNVSLYLRRLQELFYIREAAQEGRKKYFQIMGDGLLVKENFQKSQTPLILPFQKNAPQKQRESRVLEYLKKHDSIALGEYQKYVDVSSSTAARDLKDLVERGRVQKKGQGKKAFYVLGKEG